MSELVSIIMPAYNSEAYIEKAVQSVLRQTWKSWELIISDDGSVDRTGEIIHQLKLQDERISIIRSFDNLGAAAARNKALNVAKGRYIALLDSDDIWMENKLERQLGFMTDTGSDLSCTAFCKINNKGTIISQNVEVPDTITYKRMLNNSSIACLTAVYDRQSIGDVQMPNVFHADYALWLKMLRQGVVARGLNEVLAAYRIHSNSISHNKLKSAFHRWCVYRECEDLSVVTSLKHFAAYAYTGIRKTLI